MIPSASSTSPAAARDETIERPEAVRVTVLVPGVELRPLAGAHNGTRGLFTGLLTLAPGASYPYYARPATEALISLEGEAAVDIEGHRYRLGPLDAVTVMASQPRRIVNLSVDRPAVFHLALAAATPDQVWINGRFTSVEQPADATGRAGAERITRRTSVPLSELAPRTMFQDLFNAELGAQGICGGYGLFEAGARLPCHRHEFDESITIVQGTATCVIEGRRHELAACATAMVPQGRCHYFINLTLEPMAMIWVYAADRPDRIVVDESFCHPKGLASLEQIVYKKC
jgi:quercetin dioxygenase-like cupin family protein